MDNKRFSTIRLDIRDMKPEDCDYAASQWGHPVYGQYMADPYYKNGDELRSILADELANHDTWTDDFYYTVFEKDANTIVGTACAFLEKEPGHWGIGYSINHDLWGQGLATELIAGLVRFAHHQGAKVVSAKVAKDNVASVKACLRNGFEVAAEDSFTKSGTQMSLQAYHLHKTDL